MRNLGLTNYTTICLKQCIIGQSKYHLTYQLLFLATPDKGGLILPNPVPNVSSSSIAVEISPKAERLQSVQLKAPPPPPITPLFGGMGGDEGIFIPKATHSLYPPF